MTDDQKSRLRLADAISELRREISKAKLEGEGKDVRFRARAIELELSIDFEFGVEAETGLSKWLPFVEAKIKGNADRKAAHKLVMHLEIDGGQSKGEGGDPGGAEAEGETDANLIGDKGRNAPKPRKKESPSGRG
jgi:hypothetical protein